MKVALPTKKLIEILDIASRFVSRNATLPILQNIYMKASIDTLTIRATDMEKYTEIQIPCEIKLEWAITVNAKMLSDIVSTIDQEYTEITVEQQNYIMTISAGKDNFEINGIPASEYVALPDIPQDNTITLDAQTFYEGVKKVEYAITEKSFSPVLTGVFVKNTKQNIVFAGTDSFRLVEFTLKGGDNAEDFQLVIPKVAINDIANIAHYSIEKSSEEIKVQYSNNLIAFEFQIEDIKILATSLLIQGNFPDYKKEEVMPTNFNAKIILDKSQCERAIKKIGILTRDINNFIQIDTDQDTINISSGKTDKGKWKTTIPAIIEWEPSSFWINGKYITDFIKHIESENIIFNIVDSQKPIIIMDQNKDNYKYVVRPLLNN